MSAGDTIFALSSGLPPAGVAVVRVSGPATRAVLAALTDSVPEPRHATLKTLRAADGTVVDHALVLFFPAPASFTGEDVAELHVHGGRAVIAAVLAALAALPGLRPAEAGEFTRRAFLNRRMDLTQVEGLADLVAAETEAQRRQALRQADGALGRLYDGWRERLIHARALIEAELDFPDEGDVPGSVSVQVWDDVGALLREIVNHVADTRGERLRAGVEVVVLGPPNAGKSSLVNAIARRDVAIVTPEPGTTRDLIEVHLDLGGLPATLIDTAGLRDGAGAVEKEGIRRARGRADNADLVLWLSDVTAGPPSPSPIAGALTVGAKIDLIDSPAQRAALHGAYDHLVSTRTTDGLDGLLSGLAQRLRALLPPHDASLLTHVRHRDSLTRVIEALRASLADSSAPLELRAEDLRRAADALGRVTGRTNVEDLLDVIFRDFCIGK